VYGKELGPFTSWRQSVAWNGRDASGDPLPEGSYTLRLSAAGSGEAAGAPQTAEFSAELDSSLAIRPLTAASGSAGLFFTPSSETLPAFSYQVEGMIFAGRPPFEESWKSLPFALYARASFLNNLEFAAVFSALPRFGESVEPAAGASVKWSFFQPGEGPAGLGIAAQASYGWAREGPLTPLGMGTGAALSFPVSLRLAGALDIVAAPGVLWAGPDGYPQSAVPRIEASGGMIFSYGRILAGLSARWDYAPDAGDDDEDGVAGKGAGPFMSSAEVKVSLSNFVLTALGGFWLYKEEKGGFFGLGFGVLF